MKSKTTSPKRIGYIRCNTTILSTRALQARETTWLTLKRGDHHLLWHPQFVDFALNRVPGAPRIETIVTSRKFLRACQQFARTGNTSLKPLRITAGLLLDSGATTVGTLLASYLEVQTKRMMDELKVVDRSELNREELFSTLRYQFVVNSARFKTAVPIGDGTYRSYGFAAFHQQFIRGAWNSVKRDFCHAVSWDAASAGRDLLSYSVEGEMAAEQRVYDKSDWIDFRPYFAATLRSALCDSRSWDVFYSMMYRDETVSQLSVALGVSEAYISVNLSKPIMDTLRSLLSEYYNGRCLKCIRITEIRQPLLDFLPEEDFQRFVPRPTGLRGARVGRMLLGERCL